MDGAGEGEGGEYLVRGYFLGALKVVFGSGGPGGGPQKNREGAGRPGPRTTDPF